jgi:carbamoyl-phosphate synthase/aspartate carbamoyltransferase/dihydroorotase
VSRWTLPGLIDPHVHLRDPGATHKEDFESGTAAALAGGFTLVLAMPNTRPPLIDAAALGLAAQAARAKARCDYALFLGAGQDNLRSSALLADRVCGLKMYLDQTYGPLRLESLDDIEAHLAAWPRDRIVAVHAEGSSLTTALLVAERLHRPLHVCHVSRREEILMLRAAKTRGTAVTCEVTPHHLFLSDVDVPRLGAGRGEVRPPLASPEDRQALWDNLDVIDCFATDHAPHTQGEKDGPDPPPGFPGLETALGLLLTAVHEGRLTLDDLIQRMVSNPRRIYGLPQQTETDVEVDPDALWEVRAAEMHSRCGWTPFEGMRLRGRVRRVRLRARIAYEDGRVLAPPGFGRDCAPSSGIEGDSP